MQWLVVPLAVMVVYVHIFNAVSTLYFASDRTLTLKELAEHVKRNVETAYT